MDFVFSHPVSNSPLTFDGSQLKSWKVLGFTSGILHLNKKWMLVGSQAADE